MPNRNFVYHSFVLIRRRDRSPERDCELGRPEGVRLIVTDERVQRVEVNLQKMLTSALKIFFQCKIKSNSYTLKGISFDGKVFT